MQTRKLWQLVGICAVAIMLSGPSTLLATDTAPKAAAVKEAAGAAGAMETININTASADALAKIPGVGPQLSEAISSYREANGPFNTLADLTNVEGIDASLLEKIKPFISI